MIQAVRNFIRNTDASSATEMALAAPLLIALMFGSMELGNYFLTEHGVSKQVRNGARYASRLTLANPYTCSDDPSTVFQDPDAENDIINVTKTGSVDGSKTGRFEPAFWAGCGASQPVSVAIRCVDKADYGGIYTSLDGDIPVVMVSADVEYNPILNSFGFNTGGLCLHAESEVAVAGL